MARRQAFDIPLRATPHLGEDFAQRFGNAGFLGFEVGIEPAMCEARLVHQLRDGKTVRPFLTQHPRRDLHELLAKLNTKSDRLVA